MENIRYESEHMIYCIALIFLFVSLLVREEFAGRVFNAGIVIFVLGYGIDLVKRMVDKNDTITED